MENEIVNRVANSSLVQIDLDDWAFEKEIAEYDLSENLYEGLLLKEKDFREFIAKKDWSVYTGRVIAIYCSTDAIVPNWAFMLLSSAVENAGGHAHFGTVEQVRELILRDKISSLDFSEFAGKKVLLKGCGKMEVSPEIYMLVTARLRSVVDSLMFGEACSSVPVFKKLRQK